MQNLQDMCLERPDIASISAALAVRVQALELRLVGQEEESGLAGMVRVLGRLARPAGESSRVDATLRLLAQEAGMGLLDAHHAIQHLLERELVSLVDDVLEIPDLAALAASVEPQA
jgi:hypothetical protein